MASLKSIKTSILLTAASFEGLIEDFYMEAGVIYHNITAEVAAELKMVEGVVEVDNEEVKIVDAKPAKAETEVKADV